MDICCCPFQSATGLTNAVDFSGISNILYDEIKINSNYNFIFGSNINSNLSNNIVFGSNANFLYTSNLYYLFNGNGIEIASNVSNLYYNTGFIDSNLLWWRYELQATQLEVINLKANQAILSTQQSILSTTVSAQGFTLAYHTGQINALEPKVASLENNTFTKEQTSNIFITSNVLSNTSNTLADYNNLYNKPIIFTQIETSNIFITSNVLSNTSNTLADYNNLYNKPIIFTQIETSNIFVSSNVLSNTSNTLADYNNIYNKPIIFTQIETSNIFVSSNVLSNTSNTLADYNNLYNIPNELKNIYNIFTTSNHINNNFYTKSQSDTNYYNKSQIDNFNSYRPMTSNVSLKLTGSILSITLVSGGSGYSPNLTNQPLTFTKGGGQNASGTYNTNASGSVSSVSLTDGGILYTSTLVEVKAGTGNAVISATMGYFDFHNVYSALNVNGKPEIVYERADLAFGTRNPNGISYQESPDGLAGALGTNKFCGLRVKDDRMFLISNSNMLITSFNNAYVGASTNLFLKADTSNIELMCINNNAQIKMKSNTTFEKEVYFNGAVSKKIPKYFTTSRIANFDGISCLAFDLNLQTNGVSTTTIEGYTFRLFKIYFFFVNKAPRFQWTPRSYDITMSSFDADSVSAFDGFANYSSLDKSYSYQWFLYRQNFSQISFCCPTSLFGSTHLTVCYVIQDLLAI